MDYLKKPIPGIVGPNGVVTAPSTKVKINSLLNCVTRRGPFLANSAAVVAMLYNGINSTIGHYRGEHTTLNSIVSGGLAGAIFKSTRGPKQMLVASALTASAAAAWSAAKKAVV